MSPGPNATGHSTRRGRGHRPARRLAHAVRGRLETAGIRAARAVPARPFPRRTRPSTAGRQGQPTASSVRDAETARSCAFTRLHLAPARRRRAPLRISARRRARSVSAREAPLDLPVDHDEMLPVSSDTTMATRRFLRSARWRRGAATRAPCSSFGFTVSGRKQAAAATRSSWTITAPSCSGD